MLSPARPHARIPAFFGAAFAWNLGLGMTHILIPLYANGLGYSGTAIGSLLSLPILVRLGLNLLGGAWTDRIGGKRLAILSAAAFAAAGVVFAYASTFPGLLLGQFCIILSQAMFWPATWTLCSQLPGDRGVQLGRFNSITSAGQILGTVLAGLAITAIGFGGGFWLFALLGGALSLGLMQAFGAPAPRAPAAPQPLFAAYRAFAQRPSMWFAIACAFVAALPFSLIFSFYPILLVSQGFASDAAGWMIALRGVGSVCAGVTAARFVRKVAVRSIPVASALVVAIAVLLAAAFRHAAPISVLFLVLGLASGVMTLYFQLLISDLSSAQTRGSALAAGSLGWGLSHLSVPLAMGALMDSFGIGTAFYIMGVIAVAWALALAPMHAWAFRGGKPR